MNNLPNPQKVLSRHRYEFIDPPTETPANHSIDAPLLGNGDLGVAISGNPWSQRYWISKNDFWKLRKGRRFGGGPAPIGGVDLHLRDLFRVGTYRVEQDLYTGTTFGTFTSTVRKIRTTSRVAATANSLIIEISCEREPTVIEPELWIASGRGSVCTCSTDGYIAKGERSFSALCEIETGAAISLGCLTAKQDAPYQRSALERIELIPGDTVVLALTAHSNFTDEDYATASAQSLTKLLDAGRAGLDSLQKAHEDWWSDFWGESSVSIDDPVIEKQYYLSQYILASASRNPDFPPPIFGTWITTDDPAWMGDYHLNYNHMAPYYGLYSSNHIAQAAPYEAPILDFFERASRYAQTVLGIRGVYLPVGIGPKGVDTTWDDAPVDHLSPYYEEGGLFFGQKSNASYCVINMSMRWFATYDISYAKKVYPFIKAVAEFWEDYLTWDGARYVSESDSIHEGSGDDKNPILSLGLIKCVMDTVIDMGTELGADAESHKTWSRISDKLSDFPVFERNGKQVFRLCETGVDWWKSNTLMLQHIYPSGAIGPGDDPELLRIGRDTITEMDRWFDTNGMNSLYPAAVRVGYDSHTVLDKLREHCGQNLHPNGFTIGNPHGIETCSTVPNTINEMLCMSHRGVLRLFYGWPKELDAAFSTLRAHGGFLVSCSFFGGTIGDVTIQSEKGRTCVIENPWPGEEYKVVREGDTAETHTGEVARITTSPGELIIIRR